MKRIDCSKLGGYPFCQDDMEYLQNAWTEALVGVAMMGGNDPMIISGCVISKVLVGGTVYNFTVAAGWFIYNGELIRMGAMALGAVDTAVKDVYVAIARNSVADPLAFENLSTPDVINESVGGLLAQVIGMADDADHFRVSELKPFGREVAETAVSGVTAGGSGTISWALYYRKNFLNNTMQLRGLFVVATPSDFAANPSVSNILMTTLGAAYRPASAKVGLVATLFQGANRVKDSVGGYFSNINMWLGTDGTFSGDMIKPDGGVASYSLLLNCVVGLD